MKNHTFNSLSRTIIFAWVPMEFFVLEIAAVLVIHLWTRSIIILLLTFLTIHSMAMLATSNDKKFMKIIRARAIKIKDKKRNKIYIP